ncbi:hypothetical protein ES703_19048 [subsurface metagenome]
MSRDDEISKKIDSGEPICCTCKYYLDFRIPEQIAKYDPGEGRCVLHDEVPQGIIKFAKLMDVAGAYSEEFSAEFITKESKEGTPKYLVVMADSSCDKHESIFPNKEAK